MTSDAEVEVFDTTKYLLERYGCRMTKREVGFEDPQEPGDVGQHEASGPPELLRGACAC